MKSNTFINGECQRSVWLGRANGNVGAFTDNMEEFKQGLQDKALRETKKTSKYAIGSTLLPEHDLYCGTFYQTFSIEVTKEYHRCRGYGYLQSSWLPDYKILIYKEPSLRHLYLPCSLNDNPISCLPFKTKNRVPTISVSDEVIEINQSKILEKVKEYYDKAPDYYFKHWEDALARYQRIPDEETPSIAPVFDIVTLRYITEDTLKNNYTNYNTYIEKMKEYFDSYCIPYDVVDEKTLGVEKKFERDSVYWLLY